MDLIRSVDNQRSYRVPDSDPRLHRELAWFTTDSERLLGVLIENQIDFDFSWVVLAFDASVEGYRAIDSATAYPTSALATDALHAAMRDWLEKSPSDIAHALE